MSYEQWNSSTNTQERRRRCARLYPEGMWAELARGYCAQPDGLEAVVVDFSPQGAGLVVPGGADCLEIGSAFPLRMYHEGMETKALSAIIVHRQRQGAFTRIGAAFGPHQNVRFDSEAH